MAKLSQLMDRVAEAIGAEPGEVRQFGRHAREGGMLSSSGARGLAAPDATSRDAANLIIAILGSAFAKDAAKTIEECRKLGAEQLVSFDSVKLASDQLAQVQDLHLLTNNAGKVIRLPEEYQWLIGCPSFGDAVEGLIDMATSGTMAAVTKTRNIVYAAPRVHVSVMTSKGDHTARIKISDNWVATEKYNNVMDRFSYMPDGDQFDASIEAEMRHEYPIAVITYTRGPLENMKVGGLGDVTTFASMIVERRISQGVLEKIGKILR